VNKERLFKNLDLVFEESDKDFLKDDSPLLGGRPKKAATKAPHAKPRPAPGHTSRKRKSFANLLDEIFAQSPAQTAGETSSTRPTETGARRAGIDLLISSTIKAKKVERVAPEKKRVTFIIDKVKLQKIKALAKSEKAYVKDVFDRIITDYLKREGFL